VKQNTDHLKKDTLIKDLVESMDSNNAARPVISVDKITTATTTTTTTSTKKGLVFFKICSSI
jgi:hypothetical protein